MGTMTYTVIGSCPICKMGTDGRHEPGCLFHDIPDSRGMAWGWQCPVCGRGNAPWKGICDCWRETRKGQATNTNQWQSGMTIIERRLEP